jgi:hypothetical protein
MASVINIFSPGWVTSGSCITQFVPNPWGNPANPACDVWIECTITALTVWDTLSTTGFGIIEFESLDGNGRDQLTTFGDVTNLSNVNPGDLPARMFVPQLVSVTLALLNANTGSSGTVTLFQWG